MIKYVKDDHVILNASGRYFTAVVSSVTDTIITVKYKLDGSEEEIATDDTGLLGYCLFDMSEELTKKDLDYHLSKTKIPGKEELLDLAEDVTANSLYKPGKKTLSMHDFLFRGVALPSVYLTINKSFPLTTQEFYGYVPSIQTLIVFGVADNKYYLVSYDGIHVSNVPMRMTEFTYKWTKQNNPIRFF